jgi:N-formylmaleamate deformylase
VVDGRGDVAGGLGASWRSGRIALSNGFLAYHRSGGPGPPLVLSHGLTDNGLCWLRFAEAMADEFDIFLLDARGHGESSRMSDGATYDPSTDIAEAIDYLKIASPIVMGHSVGALATAIYASSRPDRVSKVILEDPPFSPIMDTEQAARRHNRFREQVLKFQTMSEQELSAMGRSMHPDWNDCEFPAWIAAKKQVDPDAMPHYSKPWQAEIAGITAPTLLIYGNAERGSIVTSSLAQEAASINSNIQAIHVRAAGHNVRRENFPAFLSAVREFLHVP